MSTLNCLIRPLKTEEIPLLDAFMYEAIFQKEGAPLLPREIIHRPELKIYFEHFGRNDDHCFVAETGGSVVGAVWVRILSGEIKGYGNVDDQTPEFAISILKPYRNAGIGTQLMQAMITHLKQLGYEKASLSVEKENYAYRMYEKLGFRIIEEPGHDYLMVIDLK